MVERSLSMREAQGSIPCFSIFFVVFQRKNKKKARLCSLREPSQNCFTRIPVDRTARKIVNTNLDQTKRTKIKSLLSGLNQWPFVYTSQVKSSQAMWTGLFESKVNLGPKTFRQAVDYFFLIYCFARANIKDVHTGGLTGELHGIYGIRSQKMYENIKYWPIIFSTL